MEINKVNGHHKYSELCNKYGVWVTQCNEWECGGWELGVILLQLLLLMFVFLWLVSL